LFEARAKSDQVLSSPRKNIKIEEHLEKQGKITPAVFADYSSFKFGVMTQDNLTDPIQGLANEP